MKSEKSIYIIGLVLLVITLIWTLLSYPSQSVLQYMADGELITETFDDPEETEQRANELRQNDIKFYHSFN